MQLDMKIRYKTVRGWSGRRYKVRMSEQEINARRILGLIGCVVVGVPAWILAMALAAGLL